MTAKSSDSLRAYENAVKAASKKLPLKSRKQRNEILEYAADDLADAYQIGAEEAQQEIILRLIALAQKESINR